jgi:hypothetical protein
MVVRVWQSRAFDLVVDRKQRERNARASWLPPALTLSGSPAYRVVLPTPGQIFLHYLTLSGNALTDTARSVFY